MATGMETTPMDVEEEGGEASASPHVFSEPESAEEVFGSKFQSHDFLRTVLEQRLFACFDDGDYELESAAIDARDRRIIDMESLLGDLRLPDDEEEFLPSRIYVRDCMKTILGYFLNDRLKRNSNRVLLGSPGVGKSVLFFIAALYVALYGNRPVVYFRKTREEKLSSAFVMVRVDNGGLRVFANRKISKDPPGVTATVSQSLKAVATCFGWNIYLDDDAVVFLDGPKHDEQKDLNAFYHYFCTSGGHPLPKNAQKDLFLWILDGWSQSEVIAAFQKLLGRTEEEAIEAYTICGGCIRDMVQYVAADKESREIIEAKLIALADRVDKGKIRLVMTTTSRNNDDDSGNPDRLRTMFNGHSKVPHVVPKPIQIVDSAIVMRCLRGRLNLESCLEALKLGNEIKSGAVVGVYFEEVLHQWFLELEPTAGITQVCRSEGTGAEGVLQLNQEGLYWIPSIPNFANIDAAVVLNGVLYVFQDTKRPGHGFNEDTFWQRFVSVVRGILPFDRVHVFIVVIKGVSNTLSVNFTRQWTPPEQPTRTRTTSARWNISCTSSTVRIDVTSADTVRTSAAAGFTWRPPQS